MKGLTKGCRLSRAFPPSFFRPEVKAHYIFQLLLLLLLSMHGMPIICLSCHPCLLSSCASLHAGPQLPAVPVANVVMLWALGAHRMSQTASRGYM